MPLVIAFSAVFFNLINGSINGYYLGNFATYELSWLYDPRFIIGMILFFIGAYINISSDNILLKLRKPGETGYKIPHGGLFKYVSTPNLFGEVIEWTGYAIATWSLPTASFAIWTFANLIPRGMDHHKWYIRNFKDYPKERKAIIPKIWYVCVVGVSHQQWIRDLIAYYPHFLYTSSKGILNRSPKIPSGI